MSTTCIDLRDLPAAGLLRGHGFPVSNLVYASDHEKDGPVSYAGGGAY